MFQSLRIADLDYTSHYISSLDNIYKAVIDDKVLVTFSRSADLKSQDKDSLNYGTYYLFHNDNESDTKNLDNLVVSNSKKFSEWRKSDFSQKIVQLNLYTNYYRLWNGMRVGDKIHRYYDLIDFSREENRNRLLYFDSTYKYEIYLDEGVISRMKITVESTHI
ncbi:hypothetical protein CEQ90_20400 [Lewinellaceae bacterium SD302]|nr:hypothetical protein CEQ90_20400 [Lewinellaceae bacterium SD302]